MPRGKNRPSPGRKSRIKGQFQVTPVFESASEVQVAIFFKHLLTDFEPTVSTAAKFARISKAQMKDLMENNDKFRMIVEEFESNSIDTIEAKAKTMAMRGDPSMIRFVLQTERPEKYGAKAKLDITHNIKSYEDVAKLSPAEREALKQKILGK